MGDAANGGGRPDRKTTAPGDCAVRDAGSPERDASDLAARGELQRAGVDYGLGVRRFFGEQGGAVVTYLRDHDFSRKGRKAGIRQNVPCEIRVEDGYG